MAYCYILISKKLKRYYIGSTELSIKKRIEQHISQHYGKEKYTASANDWGNICSN